MTVPMLVLTAFLTLITGVLLIVATRLVRALRHTVELEQRVARLQEGVNLLADTTETGFRQVATEIERMSSVGTKAASGTSASTRSTTARPTAARLRAATRRGRSVKEIAAAEQVSEGEVRLRLSLADASASGRTRKGEDSRHAPLRG